jgi:hypothetical protein
VIRDALDPFALGIDPVLEMLETFQILFFGHERHE